MSPTYEKITCASPPHLEGKQLYTLPEELLICPANVNTTRLLDKLDGDFSGGGRLATVQQPGRATGGGKPIQTIGKSGPFSAKFEEIAHCVASLCALFQPAIQADIVAHSIIRAVYYEGAARRFDIIGHVSDRVLIDHHQCRQLLASPILSGPRFSSTLNRIDLIAGNRVVLRRVFPPPATRR
ncbi:hypothetical protein HUJ05_010962 [Dendroctonus ponderosae]|nr:hypothetical protein HUJ05_010962 [Dendroctonus ponderosae]